MRQISHLFFLYFFSGNDSAIALLTARVLEQWLTKCLESLHLLATNDQPLDDGLLLVREWRAASDQLLELTLDGMEHHVDCIRHTAKKSFNTVLNIHMLLNGNY